MNQEYTVGIKMNRRSDHVVVDAEDALVAALKVKIAHPNAMITYARRRNKRGDRRHPPRATGKLIVQET